jgi:hypothetical protein
MYRGITPEYNSQGTNLAWNVSCINVFIPAWMVPPIFTASAREHIRTTDSQSPMGVKSLRPTWFEDETVAREAAADSANTLEPMHGLRLQIREDAVLFENHHNSKSKRGCRMNQLWRDRETDIASKPQAQRKSPPTTCAG